MIKSKKDGLIIVYPKNNKLIEYFISVYRCVNNIKYNSYYIEIPISNFVGIKFKIFGFSKCKSNQLENKNNLVVSKYIEKTKLKKCSSALKRYELNINPFIVFKETKKKTFIKFFGNERIHKILLLKIIYSIKKNSRKNSFFYFLKKKIKKDYVRSFYKIKKLISRGTLIQCQLGLNRIIKTNADILNLKNLFINRDQCLKSYINNSREKILCFSPEVLSLVNKNDVYLFPIAGTIKRGFDVLEDKLLENKLINDKKEVSEHVMLIDLARNDLNYITKGPSVFVKKKFLISKLLNLQHIISIIKCRKATRVNLSKLIMSINPSGTLTGSPRIVSMKIIKSMEENRGYYGGYIGFKNLEKNVSLFYVIIRSAIYIKNYLRIKASSGIVNKSNILKENKEIKNKIRTFLKR
ncbi:chorismate-binding protein [Candidatus Vidania fulgoroideorum]